MASLNDNELLHRYVKEGSETAFSDLVQRHFGLVYSAALRQVGNDASLAQDVAQIVFCDLARKAQPLTRHPLLIGWLYQSTRFAASDAVRARRARQRYEEKAAVTMNPIDAEERNGIVWSELSPFMDSVLAGLNPRDRAAILLRFFEGKSFADVAVALRSTEDASRMRVNRALEQIRESLRRRGIVTSSAALAFTLGDNVIAAVPSGLVPFVSKVALAGAAATAINPGIGETHWLWKFMTTAKSVTGIFAVVAALMLGTAIYEGLQLRTARSLLSASNRARDALRLTLRSRNSNPSGGSQQPPFLPVAPQVKATSPAAAAAASPATLESIKDRLAHIKNPHSSELGAIAGLDKETVTMVRAWMEREPEGTLLWLGSIPPQGGQQLHTTEAVIAIEAGSNPELAFAIADSISSESSRVARLGDVLRAWAPTNPAAAISAVQSADLPAAERAYFVAKIAEIKGK